MIERMGGGAIRRQDAVHAESQEAPRSHTNENVAPRTEMSRQEAVPATHHAETTPTSVANDNNPGHEAHPANENVRQAPAPVRLSSGHSPLDVALGGGVVVGYGAGAIFKGLFKGTYALLDKTVTPFVDPISKAAKSMWDGLLGSIAGFFRFGGSGGAHGGHVEHKTDAHGAHH